MIPLMLKAVTFMGEVFRTARTLKSRTLILWNATPGDMVSITTLVGKLPVANWTDGSALLRCEVGSQMLLQVALGIILPMTLSALKLQRVVV